MLCLWMCLFEWIFLVDMMFRDNEANSAVTSRVVVRIVNIVMIDCMFCMIF